MTPYPLTERLFALAQERLGLIPVLEIHDRPGDDDVIKLRGSDLYLSVDATDVVWIEKEMEAGGNPTFWSGHLDLNDSSFESDCLEVLRRVESWM